MGKKKKPNLNQFSSDSDFGDIESKLAREHEARFDPKRWINAINQKQCMTRFSHDLFDPGSSILSKIKNKDIGIFISDDSSFSVVRPSMNPKPKCSFGFIDVFAEVRSKETFRDGTLVLKFESKRLKYVSRSTLRIYYWNDKIKKYDKLAWSGVGQDADYVWARISNPGKYTIIGINAHPLVLTTIKALNSIKHLFEIIPSELSLDLKNIICKEILCNPDIHRVFEDPRLWESLISSFNSDGIGAIELPTFDTDIFGTLCDQCISLDSGLIPELPDGEWPPMQCIESRWQSFGPRNISGCIKQVVIDPIDSNRIYAASANGGIWVLNNVTNYPRETWRPLTDRMENIKIWAMAVSSSDSSIIYAVNGLGFLYCSSNSGLNWRRVSDTDLGDVSKILVHPRNPQMVFVASLSIGSNPGGFQVSLDGGLTWESPSYSGPITDAAMDPQDSSIIYIAERNSGVHKSYSLGLGDTAMWETIFPWSRATTIGPGQDWIKIALGFRNSDGTLQDDTNRTVIVKIGKEVWVNNRGGKDDGSDWEFKGLAGEGKQLGWDNVVAVDPFNPANILAGDVRLDQLTLDVHGNEKWEYRIESSRPHEDQQSIEFDRNNVNVVYIANDGGVYRSTDGGSTWYIPDSNSGTPNISDEIAAQRNLNKGLVTMEFYRVGIQGNVALGNAYHWGIFGTTDLSHGSWTPWAEGGAWEFANVYQDPKRPKRFYIFGSKLAIRHYPPHLPRYLTDYGNFEPFSGLNEYVGAIAVDERSDSNIVLVGAKANSSEPHRLMITKEGDKEPIIDQHSNTWTNFPHWDVAIAHNHHDPIVSTTFAPNDPGKAYAISCDGVIWSTDEVNDGNWYNIGRCPAISQIRQIAVNSRNSNIIYAITENEVWRGIDGGLSWDQIDNGLPSTEFNSIVAHLSNPSVIFCSADSGVFRGIEIENVFNWEPFDDDLPNAEILQIYWDRNYLYAVTHGRGLWRCRPC